MALTGRDSRHFKVEETQDLNPVVDYCAFYINACKHFSCHVNSAVLKLLKTNPNVPLTRLSLANNYVGPKGLKPLLTLIEECQTIVTVDLRGNGLENDCIEKLCNVLSYHLSIQGIDISDNPITHDGGKFVMAMLERNKNIVYCNVNRTDIFQTLIDRITMAAEQNSAIIGPKLKKNTEVEAEFYKLAPSIATTGVCRQIVPSKPRTSIRDSRPDKAPETTLFGSPRATKVQLLSEDNSYSSRRSSTSHSTIGHRVYHLRPPPPATASMVYANNFKRTCDTDREELRERYYQYRQLYNSISSSEAAKAAGNARYQLMMLEYAEKEIQASKLVANVPNIGQSQNQTNSRDDNPSCEIDVTNECVSESAVIPDIEEAIESSTNIEQTETAEWKDESILRPTSPISIGADGKTVITSKDPTVAPFVVPYTNEEQFKQLFEAGGEAYKRKDLDVAYLRWNEAMTFATENKNREWIAIVTNNIQRLSYELLVTEGTKHIERQKLDDADKSFALALEVAKKARNASWEADMIKARKKVQHAVFQQTHEHSLKLFDKATEYVDQTLDAEDDKFVSPDGNSYVSHSSAYYNDWQRMLLLKEALEGWVDAMSIAKKIPGISTRSLQDIISAAILNVAQLLISHFFTTPGFNDNPEVLAKLGTSRYTCDEAKLMHALFVEIVDSTECLSCQPFDIVAFCIMGQLAIAMNQMPLSVQYLENAVTLSEKIEDTGFCAYTNTFLSIAMFQRANYGVAENTSRKALMHWSRILEYDLSINRTKKTDDMHTISTARPFSHENRKPIANMGDESNTVDGTSNKYNIVSIGDSLIVKTVPVSVLRVCHGDAHLVLIHTMIGVHRYFDAVKALEGYHHLSYADTLHQKIEKNFTTAATLEHMTAVAAFNHSTLLYFNIEVRFDWDIDANKYTTSEILYIWAVPAEGELSFTRVDVTKSFGIPSIATLMKEVRETLFVESVNEPSSKFGFRGLEEDASKPQDLMSSGEFRVADFTIHESHELLWKAPLSTMYSILIDPVIGFLQAHAAYDNNAVITVIPSGYLWGIPWSALYDKTEENFFIEKFAIQISFGALFSSFSALNSLQRAERGHKKLVILVAPMSKFDSLGVSTCSGEGYYENNVEVSEHPSTTPIKKYHIPLPAYSLKIQKVIIEAQYKASQQLVSSNDTAISENNRRRSQKVSQNTKTNSQNTSSSTPGDNSTTDDTTITSPNRNRDDQICINVPPFLQIPSEIVSTVESLTASLPITKYLHVAAPTTSYACNAIEDTSGGIIMESSTLGTSTVLKSSDIAQIEIFASVVTLADTNINHKALARNGGNTKDGTLSLIRCLGAAGCSAVVASLWCTPDMAPSSFFEAFYEKHLVHVGSQQIGSSVTFVTDSHNNTVSLVRQKENKLNTAGALASDGTRPPASASAAVYRNKAVALAFATRDCLQNPDMRFAPRHWAPYFIVGTGV